MENILAMETDTGTVKGPTIPKKDANMKARNKFEEYKEGMMDATSIR